MYKSFLSKVPKFLYLTSACLVGITISSTLVNAGDLRSTAWSRPSSRNVAFKTQDRNVYLVAENGGGDIISANRWSVGPWETLRLIDLNLGSLRSGDVVNLAVDNGMYISAEDGGGGSLYANRSSAGVWEEITVTKVKGSGTIRSGDVVTLRTKNGYFIVAEGGGGGQVNADRTTVGPWEKFVIEFP